MSPRDLTAPPADLDLLHSAPQRFTLFAALRLIEAAHPKHPRLGEARRARDEPVRLGQAPHLHFPPGPVAGFEPARDDRPPILSTYAFGLFGPQGPLPLHVSREALTRLRHGGDPTLVRFCNIFHHRMLTLYWRAYAGARPAVEQDRPTCSRFHHRIAAAAGQPAEVVDGAVPARFFLFAAGLLTLQTRPPEALTRMVTLWFAVPVAVRELVGGWLEIPPRARTFLGAGARLGQDTMVGTCTWQRQHRFRLILGPLSLPQFLRFLPDNAALSQLRALVARVPGIDAEWDAQLVLRREEVPETRLDRDTRLGWTSWLAARERLADAGDVVLQGGR